MVEVKVKVPKDISDVVFEMGETIYVEALREVAGNRLSYTQNRLDDLRKKISMYESKYGKSFQKFSQNVPDTVEGHDDWIEWSYLSKLADELSTKINKLRLVVGK